MAERYRPEVDSFLFHVIGDGTSVEDLKHQIESIEPAPPVMGPMEDVEYDAETLESFPMAPGPAMDFEREHERFWMNADESTMDDEAAAEEDTDLQSYADGFPVVLQVRNPEWDGSRIDGFRRASRVGDVVTGHATQPAIRMLSSDEDVIRIDFSRDAGLEEVNVSVPAVHGDQVHRPPIDERGANALVGIIDGGIDVLHEAFRDDSGSTRIVALWDQRGSTGPPPVDDDGNPLYGTLYSSSDINAMISSGSTAPELGRDRQGHGTHVASIAAGRATGAFTGGMAPESGIVFVRPKLTTPAGDPRSIGYSMAHVDALAFMDRVARSQDPPLPIVTNISLGMNAGAHDGTSTLEAAFDNFTSSGRMPGRVLVKSAGNAGTQGLHSSFQIGSEQVIDLEWLSRNVVRLDDVIEVWFNSADDLTFTLQAPDGSRTPAVGRAPLPARTNGPFAGGNVYSLALDRFHRDNGDARLSLRITRGTASRILPGTWRLQVKSGSVTSAGWVDAWIERHNRMPLRFSTHVSQDGTLSIPGTANAVITVAALDRQMNGQVMSFSSRGTTRDGRQRPDIGAPGNDIMAAAAGTANDVIAMPGTSMAAPHVTGAIALLLSQQQDTGADQQLNANQIRSALVQSSRGFNGHWNSARGWGMLDAESLVDLFR